MTKKELAILINSIIATMNQELGMPHNNDIESTIKGIEGVLAGNTPAQSHELWVKERTAQGWVYGEVKDLEAKTHPCLVPYHELSQTDKMKDCVIVGAVKGNELAFPDF